jgi:hypothetical protein
LADHVHQLRSGFLEGIIAGLPNCTHLEQSDQGRSWVAAIADLFHMPPTGRWIMDITIIRLPDGGRIKRTEITWPANSKISPCRGKCMRL